MLREVTCHHIAELASNAHFGHKVGLVNPGPATKRMAGMLADVFGPYPLYRFQVSRIAKVNTWEKCCRGDVVLLRDSNEAAASWVGEVVCHTSVVLEHETACVTFVTPWIFEATSGRSSKWRRAEETHACMTEDIVCALIWAGGSGEGRMTTLQPVHG